jgi:hypothetical protein
MTSFSKNAPVNDNLFSSLQWFYKEKAAAEGFGAANALNKVFLNFSVSMIGNTFTHLILPKIKPVN